MDGWMVCRKEKSTNNNQQTQRTIARNFIFQYWWRIDKEEREESERSVELGWFVLICENKRKTTYDYETESEWENIDDRLSVQFDIRELFKTEIERSRRSTNRGMCVGEREYQAVKCVFSIVISLQKRVFTVDIKERK